LGSALEGGGIPAYGANLVVRSFTEARSSLGTLHYVNLDQSLVILLFFSVQPSPLGKKPGPRRAARMKGEKPSGSRTKSHRVDNRASSMDNAHHSVHRILTRTRRNPFFSRSNLNSDSEIPALNSTEMARIIHHQKTSALQISGVPAALKYSLDSNNLMV
jgi:hypothetical protein